jgi:hypothetical protein
MVFVDVQTEVLKWGKHVLVAQAHMIASALGVL